MSPLIDLVECQRQLKPEWEVPQFDPAGGGIDARVLFFFEKPGPKTARNGGSGMLSINNDDPTAEATHHFALIQNRIPIDWCLFANVIPWWDGTRRISSEQRKLAGEAIARLLDLLPDLRAIVLVGKTAQRAWERVTADRIRDVPVYRSDHPSPLVRARHADRWKAIPAAWPSLKELE